MSRRILKTAVVGLGRIAWSDHLPTILKNPDFEAITTVDPLHERGKEAAAEFGITHTYESVTAMLEQETPDLAVVCSPTMFHAEQTILLLNHGVHVFCDKPAASNSGEVRAMFAAAARNDRKLMIYQPRRMFPDSFAVKEILRSGKLGNVYQMKLFAGAYVRRNDWQAYLKNGGGMLRNYGVHYMDQAMYLAGESLEALACRTAKIASLGDADDVVKILLRGMKSNLLVDIDINQAAGLNPYLWLIYGSHGAAMLASQNSPWHLRRFDPAELPRIMPDFRLAARNRKYPRENIPFVTEEYRPVPEKSPAELYYENLYEYICGGSPPLVPEKDTLSLMNLLEQCLAKTVQATP